MTVGHLFVFKLAAEHLTLQPVPSRNSRRQIVRKRRSFPFLLHLSFWFPELPGFSQIFRIQELQSLCLFQASFFVLLLRFFIQWLVNASLCFCFFSCLFHSLHHVYMLSFRCLPRWPWSWLKIIWKSFFQEKILLLRLKDEIQLSISTKEGRKTRNLRQSSYSPVREVLWLIYGNQTDFSCPLLFLFF